MITIQLPAHPTADDLAVALRVMAALGGDNLAAALGRAGTMPDTAVARVPVPPAPPAQIAAVADDEDDAPEDGEGVPELDKRGIPWDARIHSSSRKINKTGEWKRQKGLQDAQFDPIEKELLAAVAAGNFQTTVKAELPPTPAPPAPTPPPPPSNGAGEIPAFLDKRTAPPPPVGDTPPVPAGAPTFADLMVKISPLIQHGKITHPRILELASSLGINGLPEFAKKPDMIPPMVMLLDAETP